MSVNASTELLKRYTALLVDGRLSYDDVRRLEALDVATRQWVLTMLERPA